MLQATLALMSLLIFLIFWAIRRKYSYWNGKGIPYLSFTDYVKLVYHNFTKPMHEVARKNYRRHGRLYGSYQGFVPTLVVGDPLLLRDIYVKDFKSFSDRIASNATGNPLWDKMMLNSPEEEWKTTRTMMSPAFTTSRLKAMIPKIITTSDEFCKRLLLEGEKKGALEVSEMFESCAMDTTAALVYSLDLNTHENLDHPLVKCCKGFFRNLGGWKMILLFTMSRVFKLLPLEFPSKKGTEYVKEFTRHMAHQRCASKEKFEDVLQLCLDAVMSGRSPDNFKISESEIEDIAAQCMLFFIAGSDTLTITLTWTAYSLALHPECQEKAIEEIDNAVKQNGVTYEALKEMPYLEAAINETLRMYTPDSLLIRRCTQETSVAGIKIHPGMAIEIQIQGMHHDPEFFPEPECFKPERFLPENKEALVPYTYQAFGAGPRNCVAQRMGIIQTKATLACLLRNIKFQRCTETPVPLKLQTASWLLQSLKPVKLGCISRIQ
uniref:Putative cytochrome n=1 Tax=Ixodes scapularis TaxID=6945 RepID=A0A4D5RMP3_IXOSC